MLQRHFKNDPGEQKKKSNVSYASSDFFETFPSLEEWKRSTAKSCPVCFLKVNCSFMLEKSLKISRRDSKKEQILEVVLRSSEFLLGYQSFALFENSTFFGYAYRML